MKKPFLQQEIFDLYDEYVHSKIDRRSFIDNLSKYAVGGLTIPAILKYLIPNYEDKIQIKSDDGRLNTEMIEYSSPKGAGVMKGQLSRPVGDTEKRPGIIVHP